MIVLVNWVTNFRPLKFQKSSILTPCFQILGNALHGDLFYLVSAGPMTLWKMEWKWKWKFREYERDFKLNSDLGLD